jgi:hypothetical protein
MHYVNVFLITMVFIGCNMSPKNEGVSKLLGNVTEVTAVDSESKAENHSGIYSFKIDEEGPSGMITVYPNSDSTYLFYLDVCRGAPSFNLGFKFGEMIMRHDTGFSSTREDEFSDCDLMFVFTKTDVTVTTADGHDDCGFGYGVYADHTYPRIDTLVPEFFIDGEGDSILFKGMTVYTYDHRND